MQLNTPIFVLANGQPAISPRTTQREAGVVYHKGRESEEAHARQQRAKGAWLEYVPGLAACLGGDRRRKSGGGIRMGFRSWILAWGLGLEMGREEVRYEEIQMQ